MCSLTSSTQSILPPEMPLWACFDVFIKYAHSYRRARGHTMRHEVPFASIADSIVKTVGLLTNTCFNKLNFAKQMEQVSTTADELP